MATPSLHIVNMMLSKGSGGIEQAFLDYCEGLVQRGHKVTPITLPDADVNADLRKMGITPWFLNNSGEWDLLAKWILKRMLKKLAPDIVVAQTHRAFALARYGTRDLCPLVGIAHNYNKRAKRFAKADAVFATTHDLLAFVAGNKVAEDKIFLIPNMIRVEGLPIRPPHSGTPVIGSMGRLVAKKGFDVYIDALNILNEKGIAFRAVLGGTGEEKSALKKRAANAGLKEKLEFLGWVKDKKAFYGSLDMFVLPSHHEPFGIVLLEAFCHGTPVVSTDSEGPKDIITPNFDALLVHKGSARELADAMEQLIRSPELAAKLATNGFVKAKTQYSIESVSERIEAAALQIVSRWHRRAVRRA